MLKRVIIYAVASLSFFDVYSAVKPLTLPENNDLMQKIFETRPGRISQKTEITVEPLLGYTPDADLSSEQEVEEFKKCNIGFVFCITYKDPSVCSAESECVDDIPSNYFQFMFVDPSKVDQCPVIRFDDYETRGSYAANIKLICKVFDGNYKKYQLIPNTNFEYLVPEISDIQYAVHGIYDVNELSYFELKIGQMSSLEMEYFMSNLVEELREMKAGDDTCLFASAVELAETLKKFTSFSKVGWISLFVCNKILETKKKLLR